MNCCFSRKAFTLKSSRYYTSATASDQARNLLHFVQLSITRQSLKLTRQSHARILLLGLSQNPFLATKLISSYANLRRLAESRLVFDSVTLKNVYLWNTLINAHVKSSDHDGAFSLFGEMCRCAVVSPPDDFTVATLAKASGEIRDSAAGKLVHGKSTRLGFVSDTIVSNSLVSMYFKFGDFDSARKVFDVMPHRNVGSWNALIAGYASLGDRIEEIWAIVKCMNVKPDGFTVSSLLPLCKVNSNDSKNWVDYGREIHCYIVRNELDLDSGSNSHMGCCLIDMYSKSERVFEARLVFDQMKKRNVYTWTAMINCYARNGYSDQALTLFRVMQLKDRVDPNRVSLVCALLACNSGGSLIGGREIHCFAIRTQSANEVALSNALINMYSKCGCVDRARWVFDGRSLEKDAITFGSMICAYGSHGQGGEALSLYREMVRRGTKPDTVAVVGILSACARSGLVEEGLEIYRSAIGRLGIEPTIEICSCVVDMLGRSGRLKEALEFVKAMKVKPGPSVWGSLVNASIVHENLEMYELAYRSLIDVEPEKASNFVSLSNSYAFGGQWGDVAEVRRAMRERGIRKEGGCSWISVNSSTHRFYVGDKSHPSSNLIYDMLNDLVFVMKGGHSFHLELST